MEYFHKEDHDAVKDFLLSDRTGDAVTIPNTRKYHFFKPISKNKLQVKEYSNSEVFTEVFVTKPDLKIPDQDNSIVTKLNLGVYVTAVYNDQ